MLEVELGAELNHLQQIQSKSYSITSHEPPFVGPMWRNLPSFTRESSRRCTLLLCNPNCTDNSTLLTCGLDFINSKIRFFCSVLVRFWFGFGSVFIGWTPSRINKKISRGIMADTPPYSSLNVGCKKLNSLSEIFRCSELRFLIFYV